MRAGIALGNEAAVVGPSSFDVDRRGRVFLLDTEQRRLAVFDRGRLVRLERLQLDRPIVARRGDGAEIARRRLERPDADVPRPRLPQALAGRSARRLAGDEVFDRAQPDRRQRLDRHSVRNGLDGDADRPISSLVESSYQPAVL